MAAIDTLVVALLALLAGHFPGVEPRAGVDFTIAFADQASLDQSYFAAHAPAGLAIAASFDPHTGRVLLASDFDPNDAYDRSLLLHELVHVHQHLRDDLRGVEAILAYEHEAHALQARYLHEAGEETLAALVKLQPVWLSGAHAQ